MSKPQTLAAALLLPTLFVALVPGPATADDSVLPPLVPWDGRSRELMLAPDAEWVTPAEKTALGATPRYDETVAWLERLTAAAPELTLVSLGRSGEGRDVWMVVASRDGATPEALRASGKPILLAHGGIHAGEIDGKDAGLMFLRDLTVGGRQGELLDRAHFLFVPILNVDGHERFSPWGRMNQRGPAEMGWRTNRRNLNLNRDFAKLDTPELRALVAAIERWQPDLYLDLHVTDGADYQYDITYGWNPAHAWSPAIAGWLDEVFRPAVDRELEAWGHVPGPLVLVANGRDLAGGFLGWTAGPRFSNGYGDARHLATVLVENHSLKPYDQRVLGTYVLLAGALDVLGREFDGLRRATDADRAARRSPLPLAFGVPTGEPFPTVPFKAIRSELELSPVSGNLVPRWTGEPEEIEATVVPFTRVTASAERPAAYYVPAAWGEIAERLSLHGIELERLEQAVTVEVEMYRLPDAGLAESRNPFEGHARVDPGELVVEKHRRDLPAGSWRVPTDQPLGDLVMLLLEPASPDSYFQWGFLLEILNRTEYFEAYAIEPMARRMLADDAELAAEFRQKLLTDREFAGDPRARLEWFYEKTPYYDREYRLYPIARER